MWDTAAGGGRCRVCLSPRTCTYLTPGHLTNFRKPMDYAFLSMITGNYSADSGNEVIAKWSIFMRTKQDEGGRFVVYS